MRSESGHATNRNGTRSVFSLWNSFRSAETAKRLARGIRFQRGRWFPYRRKNGRAHDRRLGLEFLTKARFACGLRHGLLPPAFHFLFRFARSRGELFEAEELHRWVEFADAASHQS